jgi:hypothetical protein
VDILLASSYSTSYWISARKLYVAADGVVEALKDRLYKGKTMTTMRMRLEPEHHTLLPSYGQSDANGFAALGPTPTLPTYHRRLLCTAPLL